MAKNPGQNNNQEEGPPDLDELLNDLGNKIGRIFGKKKPHKKDPSLILVLRIQTLHQVTIICRSHPFFSLLF